MMENDLLTWLYCCTRLAGPGGGGRKARTTGRMDLCQTQLFDIGRKAKAETRKQKCGNAGGKAWVQADG